jgi:hypothetical protein
MTDILTLAQSNLIWAGAVLFGVLGLIAIFVLRGHSLA